MFILFFWKLCNSCLSCILWACVLVLYIFTNVFQACLGDFASWICTIMESDTLTENKYKTFLTFSCQVLLAWICCCVGFSGRGGFVSSPVMNYQYPFPIKKFMILNFHTWKLFLFSFSIAIWKRPSAISQGTTQCLLRVSQMILIPSLGF
jgi:hypothetical protein